MCGCGCDLIRADDEASAASSRPCSCAETEGGGRLRPCCAARRTGLLARLASLLGALARLGRLGALEETSLHRSAET